MGNARSTKPLVEGCFRTAFVPLVVSRRMDTLAAFSKTFLFRFLWFHTKWDSP